MAEDRPLNDDLESFAAALGNLTPRPSSLDAERLKFEVWRNQSLAEQRTKLGFWKWASVVSSLTAVLFAGLWVGSLLKGPVAQSEFASTNEVKNPTNSWPDAERSVALDFDSTALSRPHELDTAYITMRNRVLAEGIENLPWSPIMNGNSGIAPVDRDEVNPQKNIQILGG